MSLSRRAVLGLIFLCFSGAVYAAAASVQLDDPVVFITAVPKASNDTTPQKGTGELVVRVQGSDQPPKVEFEQLLGTVAVTKDPISSWREEAGETGTRIWHFLLEVTDLPANTLQKRTATVTIGSSQVKLPFWITNRAVRSPQFNDPVKPWLVGGLLPGSSEPRCTSILVSPGDIPATGIRLLQSNLVRESPRGMIRLQDLWLCQQSGCKEKKPVWIPASRAETVWVCLSEDFRGHGKFLGTVTLGAAHSAEVKTVNLEIQKSDLLTRIAGFIVIIFGVWLGWWIKVLAKSRLNRLQALVPALALRDRLAALLVRLDQVPEQFKGDVAKLRTRINDLMSELDETNLDREGFLPSSTVLPWRQTTTDSAALYKAFLDKRSDQYASLEALVKEGVEGVLERLPAKDAEAVAKALQSLSEIAVPGPLPKREEVRKEIQTILQELDRPGLEVAAEVSEKPLTSEQVRIQIERLSRNVWLAWGLLTALAGLATLILTNPGFGTSLDFIFALLWGVGIPSVLNQLTPDTVTTEIGVSIPA